MAVVPSADSICNRGGDVRRPTLRNMLEHGGTGGNGIHAGLYYGGGGAGGGGLGAGGALYRSGAATLNVSVTGNSAVGGAGAGFGGINPQFHGGPIPGQGGWLNG